MTRHPPSAPAAANARGAQSAPTPYADLNTLLRRMVEGVARHLGENLVGVYLQGSFALGDFDERSDVDLLIAIGRDLAADEHADLQAMHHAFHELPNPWAQRLEVSYFPTAILRLWSQTPRDPPGEPRPADWADPATSGRPPRVYPLWFKGSGEAELVRSEHDNTQVVRWVTREHGVALFWSPTAALIDPVDAAALCAEIGPLLEEVAGWRNDPTKTDVRWMQAFFVLLCCRMLHSLQTGRVTSKRAATDWAAATLDPRWAPLIQSALKARHEPLDARLAAADPREAAETSAFMGYAADYAATCGLRAKG